MSECEKCDEKNDELRRVLKEIETISKKLSDLIQIICGLQVEIENI